jgi:dihydrofolate synthase/folylpolyglutamate synthase
MEGNHQARNAALSIAIVDLLRDQGIKIPSEAITAGLGQLECAGRIERIVLPENVLGIVDAAHNHDSIAALCDCLRGRLPDRRITVVFGTSVDKSAEPMLALLADITDQLILTRFLGNPRFQPPAELKPLVPAPLAAKTSVMEDPIEACAAALASVTPGGALVICGSFFLAAECRGWLAAKSS